MTKMTLHWREHFRLKTLFKTSTGHKIMCPSVSVCVLSNASPPRATEVKEELRYKEGRNEDTFNIENNSMYTQRQIAKTDSCSEDRQRKNRRNEKV